MVKDRGAAGGRQFGADFAAAAAAAGRSPTTLARPSRGRLGQIAAAWCAGIAALLGLATAALAANKVAGDQKFQADEWVTECEPAAGSGADCSITAPFWDEQDGHKGSFALVVMLQAGDVAVVGQPFPVRAVLRVDKNPAIECRQSRYCLFAGADGRAFIKELAAGSLILVDVFTGSAGFHFSLTPTGYRAGLAKIGAWGYRFSRD